MEAGGSLLHLQQLTCLDGASLHLMWVATQQYEQQPEDGYCCPTYSMEVFFETLVVTHLVNRSVFVMEPECSVPHSQWTTTGSYPQTHEPSTSICLTFVQFFRVYF